MKSLLVLSLILSTDAAFAVTAGKKHHAIAAHHSVKKKTKGHAAKMPGIKNLKNIHQCLAPEDRSDFKDQIKEFAHFKGIATAYNLIKKYFIPIMVKFEGFALSLDKQGLVSKKYQETDLIEERCSAASQKRKMPVKVCIQKMHAEQDDGKAHFDAKSMKHSLLDPLKNLNAIQKGTKKASFLEFSSAINTFIEEIDYFLVKAAVYQEAYANVANTEIKKLMIPGKKVFAQLTKLVNQLHASTDMLQEAHTHSNNRLSCEHQEYLEHLGGKQSHQDIPITKKKNRTNHFDDLEDEDEHHNSKAHSKKRKTHSSAYKSHSKTRISARKNSHKQHDMHDFEEDRVTGKRNPKHASHMDDHSEHSSKHSIVNDNDERDFRSNARKKSPKHNRSSKPRRNPNRLSHDIYDTDNMETEYDDIDDADDDYSVNNKRTDSGLDYARPGKKGKGSVSKNSRNEDADDMNHQETQNNSQQQYCVMPPSSPSNHVSTNNVPAHQNNGHEQNYIPYNNSMNSHTGRQDQQVYNANVYGQNVPPPYNSMNSDNYQQYPAPLNLDSNTQQMNANINQQPYSQGYPQNPYMQPYSQVYQNPSPSGVSYNIPGYEWQNGFGAMQPFGEYPISLGMEPAIGIPAAGEMIPVMGMPVNDGMLPISLSVPGSGMEANTQFGHSTNNEEILKRMQETEARFEATERKLEGLLSRSYSSALSDMSKKKNLMKMADV